MKNLCFHSPKSYMTAVLEFLNDSRKTEMGIKDSKLHKYNTKVTTSTPEGLPILKKQRCTVAMTHSLKGNYEDTKYGIPKLTHIPKTHPIPLKAIVRFPEVIEN